MDMQDFHKASNRKVGFAILNSPVVHSWDVVIISEALMAGVAFPSPQHCQLDTDTLER